MVFSTGTFAVPDSDDEPEEHENLTEDNLLLLRMCACPGEKNRLVNSWRFPRYSGPIHWLVHGHMTSSNKTFYRQFECRGRQHCKSYDVKRETVHCYPRNVDRYCT